MFINIRFDAFTISAWISNFNAHTLKALELSKVEMTAKLCKSYLKQFAEFYAAFDFSRYVVCPYLGIMVKIKSFDESMPQK